MSFIQVPILHRFIEYCTIEANPKRTTKLRPAGFGGFGVVLGSKIRKENHSLLQPLNIRTPRRASCFFIPSTC